MKSGLIYSVTSVVLWEMAVEAFGEESFKVNETKHLTRRKREGIYFLFFDILIFKIWAWPYKTSNFAFSGKHALLGSHFGFLLQLQFPCRVSNFASLHCSQGELGEALD